MREKRNKQNKIDRRNFLKTAGAAGLGSIFASAKIFAGPNEPNTIEPDTLQKTQKAKFPQVPRRKLGKTGIEVPCLALGTLDICAGSAESHAALEETLKWGVNYWDTANNYRAGNSELGIGEFLSKNPEARKNLFIVSKASGAKTPEDVEDRLQTSLKRMNTKYIDLYYGVHGCKDPAQLTDELKQWAKDAKKRKVIRFFGFSTLPPSKR